MFITIPTFSIDLETIKLDIYYHEESSAACLIILNGFVNNANIGGRLVDCFMKPIEESRNHIVIDCSKLTHLSQSAGGLAFLHIAKQLQQDGLKLVLLNFFNKVIQYRKYYQDTFGHFFSFMDLQDSEVYKYWYEIEIIINNESLFNMKNVSFPTLITCPFCRTVIAVRNEGIFKCNECKAIFNINKYGVLNIK